MARIAITDSSVATVCARLAAVEALENVVLLSVVAGVVLQLPAEGWVIALVANQSRLVEGLIIFTVDKTSVVWGEAARALVVGQPRQDEHLLRHVVVPLAELLLQVLIGSEHLLAQFLDHGEQDLLLRHELLLVRVGAAELLSTLTTLQVTESDVGLPFLVQLLLPATEMDNMVAAWHDDGLRHEMLVTDGALVLHVKAEGSAFFEVGAGFVEAWRTLRIILVAHASVATTEAFATLHGFDLLFVLLRLVLLLLLAGSAVVVGLRALVAVVVLALNAAGLVVYIVVKGLCFLAFRCSWRHVGVDVVCWHIFLGLADEVSGATNARSFVCVFHVGVLPELVILVKKVHVQLLHLESGHLVNALEASDLGEVFGFDCVIIRRLLESHLELLFLS